MGGRFSLLLAGWISLVIPAAWGWDCSNAFRTEISLTTGAAYSEEIRIELTSADFPAEYTFTPNGDDVRVLASDDTTPIDHFVTGWDSAARTAVIYIRPGALPASSTDTVYIYYGDAGAASAGDVTAVFPATGLRLHSRVSTADPTDAGSARAAFAAATTDVDDTVRASITGLNNRALGGTNGDFGWCISALLEVTPATAGTWEFRYGADFGRGGHLYVQEQELEQQWNDDLWWAGNFANTAETLEGSIALTPGWHRYEGMGFEGCCDGTVGWQARAPGGPWQDMNTTNFTLRGARCVPGVAVTPSAPASCSTTLDAAKALSINADILGSAMPYALPGSIIDYDITLTNPGQAIDADSIVIADVLPPNVKLIVSGASAFQRIEGSPPSGLTLNWIGPGSTTDEVEFSTDGTNWSYSPIPDADNADAAVTHVRFSPSGAMAAHDDATGSPSVTIRLQAIVE